MKVSVIIPSYNRKAMTTRAVNSVLAQTYPDVEVLVIDDASRDEELYQPQPADAARVRVIRHQVNAGVSEARNTGVREAEGPLIAFLDSDDYWYPHKLENQLALFHRQKNTDQALFYSAYHTIDPSFSTVTPFSPLGPGQAMSDYLFLHYGCMHVNTWLVRKSFLEKFPFNRDLKQSEEWDVLLRMEAAGARFIFDPTPCAVRNVDLREDRLTTRTNVESQKHFMDVNARHLTPQARAVFESINLEAEHPSGSAAAALWARTKFFLSLSKLTLGQRISLFLTYFTARVENKIKMRLYRKKIAALACGALLLGLAFGNDGAYAQTPEALIRDDHVGVCTHFEQGWNVPEIMPMVSQLGVGWIRDGVSWSDIEPKPRQYTLPPKLIEWLNAAQASHLKVLLILAYGNKAYKDPFDPVAYAGAEAFLATHLKDKIAALEVLNEPNNFGFQSYYGGAWNGYEKDGSVSSYVRKYATLLSTTVLAVKKVNPGMPVIGLGAPAPATFRMIQLGLPAALDGITDHPYSGDRSIPETIPYGATPSMLKRDGIATADFEGTYVSQIAMFKAWAVKYHLRPLLWNTEWGYSTVTTHETKSNLSQQAQAVYILRRLIEQRALGVKSFYYDFRDDGGDPTSIWQNYGLVDIALNRKQSYFAIQRFTRSFANLEAEAPPKEPYLEAGQGDSRQPENLRQRCYGFRDPSGSQLWIAAWKVATWSASDAARPATLHLPLAEHFTGATCFDFLSGDEQAVPIVTDAQGHQTLSIPLSANPVMTRLVK